MYINIWNGIQEQFKIGFISFLIPLCCYFLVIPHVYVNSSDKRLKSVCSKVGEIYKCQPRPPLAKANGICADNSHGHGVSVLGPLRRALPTPDILSHVHFFIFQLLEVGSSRFPPDHTLPECHSLLGYVSPQLAALVLNCCAYLRGLGMRYVSQEEDSLRSGLGGVRGMRTMYEI